MRVQSRCFGNQSKLIAFLQFSSPWPSSLRQLLNGGPRLKKQLSLKNYLKKYAWYNFILRNLMRFHIQCISVRRMVYNYPYNIHNVLYLIIYDPITMLHWWPQEGIIAATYCITSRLLHQKLPV